MKNRLSLLVLMLTFICLAASGQKNNNTPQSTTPTEISLQDSIQSLQVAISSLHDSIQSVQSAYYTQKDSINASLSILLDSIQSLQVKIQKLDVEKQMNQLEKEFEKYRWDFGQTVNNFNDKTSILISIFSLIIAACGIAIPYVMNSKNEKYMEKLLQDAKDKADKAENALNDLQPKVEKAEGVVSTIEGLKGNVVETTKKAKAIQFFIQAMQENDPDRAIALYDKCINEDPDFAEAYNNRGYLRYRKGEIDGAKEDFENAIVKKENYSEAYNNLGVLLFSQKHYDEAEKNFELAGEYAEAKLNLGLLKYANGNERDAETFIGKAIKVKPTLAEAYYIRGLINSVVWSPVIGVEYIIKAKEYKPNVIEAYPNRNLLTGKIKEWDNSFKEVAYSRDFKTLFRVPDDKKGNFKIPNSVTMIGDYAFEGCTDLTSIIIPSSVTEIGKYAFAGCMNITSIDFPNKVIEIGRRTFRGCTSLTEIHLKHTSHVDFSEAFRDLDLSKITLYVPKGSIKAYKKDPFYGQFKEIIEE